METVISVKNVSKKYRIYDRPRDRLIEVFHPFKRKFHRDYWALENISFDVIKGEALGVIGRNGSGKSTLLQVICGILKPTSGQVERKGRVSALLELGAGFNPDFTGRSNAYINGILMGYTEEEMRQRMDDIMRFADIGEFIDQPVKYYSSGMYMRLAFACALNVKPDILVIDEAMSVGDIFFQQKCFDAMRRIIAEGATCIFVSHDMSAVSNFCGRAMVLERGGLAFIGSPAEAALYYSFNVKTSERRETAGASSQTPMDAAQDDSETIKNNLLPSAGDRQGSGEIAIRALRVTDENNIDTLYVQVLSRLRFHLLIGARESVANPVAGIYFIDRFGNSMFSVNTTQLNCVMPSMAANDEALIIFEVTFNIQPGLYTFGVGISMAMDKKGGNNIICDLSRTLGPITVASPPGVEPPFYGLVQMPVNVTLA
jgi:ABC-type polysaccharide/polyol phosphate transport system ATPase subunit